MKVSIIALSTVLAGLAAAAPVVGPTFTNTSSIFKRIPDDMAFGARQCADKNPSLASAIANMCTDEYGADRDPEVGNEDVDAQSDADILHKGTQWGIIIKGNCQHPLTEDHLVMSPPQLVPNEYCWSQWFDMCNSDIVDEDGGGIISTYGSADDSDCQTWVIPSLRPSGGLDWGIY